MSFQVTITLTTTGKNTGPNFDLYSNLDNYTTPFATNVLKSDLITGYVTFVNDGTSTVRCVSNGSCTNYIDMNINGITPTPTPTNTQTPTPTPTNTQTPTITPTPTSYAMFNGYGSSIDANSACIDGQGYGSSAWTIINSRSGGGTTLCDGSATIINNAWFLASGVQSGPIWVASNGNVREFGVILLSTGPFAGNFAGIYTGSCVTCTSVVTPTPTPTQTPTPTHSTFYDVVFYDNTADNVCYNSAYGFSMSGNDTTFCNSTVFTSSGWYGVPTGTYYLGYGGNTRNVTHTSATNFATTYDAGCAACPVTPTPTPTNTQTPTPTHTTTPTPTPPPTYLYYSVDRRATCNTGIENPVAMFVQLPYAFTPTLNGWYRDSAGSCTYSYRISNITPTNPGIYTPVPVDAVTYADSTTACGSGCIPTPTPTPTPTTTPIITYNYYSITKYNCPGCTINTTGLFGRTTDPFTLTNGNYYNNGDGFVYLVNFGTAGPSYDVDLDGSASSGTNCPGTCSI